MSPEVGFHGYHHVCPFSAHTPQLHRRPQRKDKLPLANFRQRREAASAPQDFPFDHKHRRAESQHCVLGRPSEPGRRTTSTARNASQQNSISASTPDSTVWGSLPRRRLEYLCVGSPILNLNRPSSFFARTENGHVSASSVSSFSGRNHWSCQWKSLWVIFHSSLHLSKVNTSEARALAPASFPDQR